MAKDETGDRIQRSKDRLARSLVMRDCAVAAMRRSAILMAASKDVLQGSHFTRRDPDFTSAAPLAPDELPVRSEDRPGRT